MFSFYFFRLIADKYLRYLKKLIFLNLNPFKQIDLFIRILCTTGHDAQSRKNTDQRRQWWR